MRINRFIAGFLMGMVLGLFLFMISFPTGRVCSPRRSPGLPSPLYIAGFTAENAETAENSRWVLNTIFSQPIASPPPGKRSAGLCLVAAGRPAENDSASMRINDTQQIAGPNGLPPAAGPNLFATGHPASPSATPRRAENTEKKDPSTMLRASWLDDLIERIWQQESSGKLNPPDGDNGRAIGPLQIHAEILIDINKKFDTDFTVEDCRDITKAKIIAKLYIQMWMDNYKEEISARIFNGGPRGWEKTKTREYYQKMMDDRRGTIDDE